MNLNQIIRIFNRLPAQPRVEIQHKDSRGNKKTSLGYLAQIMAPSKEHGSEYEEGRAHLKPPYVALATTLENQVPANLFEIRTEDIIDIKSVAAQTGHSIFT